MRQRNNKKVSLILLQNTIPPANNRILSGGYCGGDGCMGYKALFLIFFLIINFVKLTIFVNALFDEVSVAVCVDMEIKTENDSRPSVMQLTFPTYQADGGDST
jgi:hypothetical protein